MFYAILFLVLFAAIAQGFMRVIAYFANWLAGGRKVDDARALAAAEEAREHSDAVLEQGLAQGPAEGGAAAEPRRRLARWEATGAAVDEYLDSMQLGWYQLVVIFFLGCMAGLLIEEVWMLVTAGLTENRVGLVWGPFSPLYGFGATLLTWFCFRMRRRGAGAWQVFLVAALVGGLLEQVTGWGMQELFHASSWTYEHLPDHITQWVAWRFLAFWGLLGLVWSRVVMPRLLYTIGMPTTRRQVTFVTLVAVFMVADIAMTLVCFQRKTARDAGEPAANAFEEWVDENYSDEFIAARFQNMTITDAGDEA